MSDDISLLQVEYVRRREQLLPARAALLIVDIQEKLAAAMPPAILEQTVANVKRLIATAQAFHLPIVVSQQYPKGLGPTLPALVDALATAEAAGASVYRFDKTEFSVAQNEEFQKLPPAEKVGPLMAREQWLVTGMETHICIYQSVRDFVGPACAVHVISDAVASRTTANFKIGIDLCRETGARITSTEVAAYDLMAKAGTPQFKLLSPQFK